MSGTDQAHKERQHFFGAAKLSALLTVLSRIAGMVRAMAIAALSASPPPPLKGTMLNFTAVLSMSAWTGTSEEENLPDDPILI